MNFAVFAHALAAHFVHMSQLELFRTSRSGDDIWDTYLGAFPEGTDPIFKVRTQHNGSYDRQFVRELGNVVCLKDNEVISIWDVPDLPYPYNEVCAKVSAFVRASEICKPFVTDMGQIGHAPNVVQLPDGATHQFTHFQVPIVTRHRNRGNLTVDTVVGTACTRAAVFRRGLTEISFGALTAVIELIEQRQLYRGDEFESSVRTFRELKKAFLLLDGNPFEQAKFVWRHVSSPVAALRNSVIGTLLTDLSEGIALERALSAYETKVAPTNYRRPTAAITPAMITKALGTIRELGLEPSLNRRFANIRDVSVNDILWVSGNDRGKLKGGLSELLMSEVRVNPRQPAANSIAVSADDFVRDVLPSAQSVELFFGTALVGNLMSLTAPVDPDAPPLFKWDNGFAWSYRGNITDSITEKVKAAGGNVNAKLRVSLAWYNFDDLDLHAECPDGYIYYVSKRGILDVDMNAGRGTTRTPVENLAWTNPKDGTYTIWVHQFQARESTNVGFALELAFGSTIMQFSYPHAVKGKISAIQFKVLNGTVKNIQVLDKSLEEQASAGRPYWGIQTEHFVPVRLVLNSPNHWGGRNTGNKHTFFILEGCATDTPTRGIYNEFLRSELETHGNLFETLGAKTMCEPTPDQLSGLGFSSTKRETVIFRVSTPTATKIYSVAF